MNTIHDMGGMDGFGSIRPEENEPVFHHRWEGRVYALTRAVGPWGRGREWPSFRYTLESIPPVEYLGMSYYERWFRMMTTRLLVSRLVSETELETGYPDPGAPRPQRLPAPNPGAPGAGLLDMDVPARFAPDDRVRARNLHPRGHTRQPRYVRGRRGTVVEDYGVYALQDTDADGRRPLDRRPQHVYSVRFESRELWGARGGASDAVYVDLWEDYLEPV